MADIGQDSIKVQRQAIGQRPGEQNIKGKAEAKSRKLAQVKTRANTQSRTQ